MESILVFHHWLEKTIATLPGNLLKDYIISVDIAYYTLYDSGPNSLMMLKF